jgi:hypothetical protein
MADSPLISPKTFLKRLARPNITLPDKFLEPIDKKEPQLYFVGKDDKFLLIDDIPIDFAVLYKGNHLGAELILKEKFYSMIDSFLSKLN